MSEKIAQDQSKVSLEKEKLLTKKGYKFNPARKEWAKYSDFEVSKIDDSFVKEATLIELFMYIE